MEEPTPRAISDHPAKARFAEALAFVARRSVYVVSAMRDIHRQTKQTQIVPQHRKLRGVANLVGCLLAPSATAACGDDAVAKDAASVSDAGQLERSSEQAAGTAGGSSGSNPRSTTMPDLPADVGTRAPTPMVGSMEASGAAAVPGSDSDAGVSDISTPDSNSEAGTDIAAEGPSVAPLVFATVEIDEGTSLPPLGNGDLWTSCWSDDDALYVAAGDGSGFGLLFNDLFTARIDGLPGEAGYRGTQLAVGAQVSDIWSGSDKYTRKPTGMLCLQGDLFLAVQDLAMSFDDAPAATIARSTDKGRTWSWDRSGPMFSNREFTTIMFLDYGKDSEHAPKDHIYAYGLDGSWAFSEGKPGPTRMYLARVPKDRVQSREDWEFFAGINALDGTPRFDRDIGARQPVLEDTRRVCTMPLDSNLTFQNMTTVNQGGVVYNAPLARYIYSSWTEYTFEFYEAPTPWGPFKLFYSKDFGVWPWDDTQNGGYATTIPSKFISADGKHMLLQANAWESYTGKNNYSFSLRKLKLEPPQESRLDNERGNANLAGAATGAVRLTRALRAGHSEVMNDGKLEGASEDSYNGEAKDQDYWGYTWAKALHMNALRYTPGEQSAQGGFFEQLTVQKRQGDSWVDVPLSAVEPANFVPREIAAFTTYTLRFDAIVTDGIRISGRPGGSEHFTSIAELSVHYE